MNIDSLNNICFGVLLLVVCVVILNIMRMVRNERRPSRDEQDMINQGWTKISDHAPCPMRGCNDGVVVTHVNGQHARWVNGKIYTTSKNGYTPEGMK